MKRETRILSWARALLIYWPAIVLVSLILEPVSLLAGVFSGRARHAVVWLWSAICLKLVSDVSVRGYRTAEDAIRLQPVLAVGAALVVGVVIGALLFSRDD